ncbi:MAG TPA: phosphatidylserine decarboxylase family protein [Deltaproteobacteria bacterium]|nr:phosphatidylserine decarboxylase family protein [Candidatus Binatota bacterium]HIL12834.1 phosphatidylserine decarboxylase family protein [Deltaproteobacteria bacterium]
MKFASEGYRVAGVPAAAGLALLGLSLYWPSWQAVGWVFLLLATGTLLFFRDPERTPEGDESTLLAPADGRVVFVGEVEGGHRLVPGATRRVSIFMSPLDVHINRSPMPGTVSEVEHKAGSFRAAFREDASDGNENNTIVLDASATGAASTAAVGSGESGLRIAVVQVAGWLARRIICRVKEGETLGRGERYGLIMFSSRVDVYLPPGIEVLVSAGQRVQAGATALARLSA